MPKFEKVVYLELFPLFGQNSMVNRFVFQSKSVKTDLSCSTIISTAGFLKSNWLVTETFQSFCYRQKREKTQSDYHQSFENSSPIPADYQIINLQHIHLRHVFFYRKLSWQAILFLPDTKPALLIAVPANHFFSSLLPIALRQFSVCHILNSWNKGEERGITRLPTVLIFLLPSIFTSICRLSNSQKLINPF